MDRFRLLSLADSQRIRLCIYDADFQLNHLSTHCKIRMFKNHDRTFTDTVAISRFA